MNDTNRIIESTRCIFIKSDNTQCKNKTKKSPYCWTHLRKVENLRIKKSGIKNANLGLFSASKPIPKGTNIAKYTGKISKEPIQGPYVLEINKKKFIDGNSSKDTASYANSCKANDRKKGLCAGNNSKLSLIPKKQEGVLKAIKTIPKDTEIFTSYGNSYW